jgi:hypothetical protein
MLPRLYCFLFQDPTANRVFEWFGLEHKKYNDAVEARYLQMSMENAGFQANAVNANAAADAYANAIANLETMRNIRKASEQKLARNAAILAQAAGLPSNTRPAHLPSALAAVFRFEQEYVDKWYPAAALKFYATSYLKNDPQFFSSGAMQRLLDQMDYYSRLP